MKRNMTGLALSLVLLVSITGCGGNLPSAAGPQQTESTAANEGLVSEAGSSVTPEESSDMPSPSLETSQEETMENSILVAYFSATGTTEQVAQQAAEILDAELYEILPEDPYTEEDLAYYTGGRADQEQDDPSARPAINGSVEDMSQYDTVLLGYPIWHGQAPRIISTFLERYDFSGKTIIPFCTSHSSGVGSSADHLHELCGDTVQWMEGTRFAGDTTREEIEDWLRFALQSK